MAEEYSKYKLYRKYKTEDGVNYTPLDEYQALADGSTNNCDCGYYELSSTTRHFSCVNGNEYMTINSVKGKTFHRDEYVFWAGSIYENYEPLISDYTIIITDYNKDDYNSPIVGGTARTLSLSVDIEVLKDFELNIFTLSKNNEELGGTIIDRDITLNICINNWDDCEYVGNISNTDSMGYTRNSL